jgi:hypothetical protein
MGFGYVEGVTHDYKRHGTTTLFAALDVLTGQVLARRVTASGGDSARKARSIGSISRTAYSRPIDNMCSNSPFSCGREKVSRDDTAESPHSLMGIEQG